MRPTTDRFGTPVLNLRAAKVRKARKAAPTTQRESFKSRAAFEHLLHLVGEMARGRDIGAR